MIKIVNVSKEFKLRETGKTQIRSFLCPNYKVIKAVDNVSFDLREGEIFGLLGPNGAGKTTLIKMLCGLLQPSYGEITFDGSTVESNKSRIGLMLGSSMVYHRITGYDNLEYFARLYDVKDYDGRIRELAHFLGISDFLEDYVEVYSEGMKTKLALARALIHDPDIILLDEPTLGLDPHISLHLREKIIELRRHGKTIMLATHYMDEADYLCDRIGILNKGKLVKVGTTKNLKKHAEKENATLSDVFIELTGDEL